MTKGIEELSQPNHQVDLDLLPDTGKLQRGDPTLKLGFEKFTEVKGVKQDSSRCLEDATYIVKRGIVYQCKCNVEALALPCQFRQRVIDIGHSVSWSGHMAFQKTCVE